ncbi:MAG TPA: hypothetical protein PKD37_05105 [Oligoflexia bacterium]|nr:hypothetical protein [Oligoflexia bacterium]HMP27345.1 hypothetical protein [Oligoflexia bacterium]
MGNKKRAERKRRERGANLKMLSLLALGLVLSGSFTFWEIRQKLKLVKVDGSSVCMLDDLFAASGNHPSQIEGLTYYCCYKNCEEYFAEKEMSRFAQDPVSGVTVNKANSVYGRAHNGKIFYFENEENLGVYLP